MRLSNLFQQWGKQHYYKLRMHEYDPDSQSVWLYLWRGSVSVGSMKLESNGRFLFRASSLALHITQLLGILICIMWNQFWLVCWFDKATLCWKLFVGEVRVPKADHWNSFRHFVIDLLASAILFDSCLGMCCAHHIIMILWCNIYCIIWNCQQFCHIVLTTRNPT